MSSLSIGLSGLQVSQKLLDLTGQNVANAGTPGYHLEVANLADLTAGASAGMGVTMTGVTRVVDQGLQDAVVNNSSNSSGIGSQLDGLTQLQSYLAPGTGSLNDALQNFFTQAEALSTQPDSVAQRSVVVSSANDLANQLNTTTNNLDQLRSGLADQAKTSVDQANGLIAQIAQLNAQIHDGSAGDQTSNGLLDQRDQAISSLAQLVNVQVVQQPFGQVNVLVGGTPVIEGSSPVTLSSSINSQGQMVIQAGNGSAQQPIDITGGSLGGTLNLYNTILPAVRSQFDNLAQGLVTQINSIQATGLGLGGPMTSLTSTQTVANTNQPLAASNLSFPPTAGDLYITVTQLATGQRSLEKIPVDPVTESLSNLASSISTIPHLQAVVDPQAGTLNLIAQPGYGFDFTGNLSSTPDAQTITGTAAPTISGQYTGSANDALTFQAVGSGTVGQTPNLALQVRNGAGALISTLNIGQGYVAGTPLPDVLGVKVTLPTGTINNGDSFQVNVAANPDTAGILPALGLNAFFVGNNASGIHVRPDLLANPGALALSTSGQPGDASNLNKLVALGTQNTMAGQTQSFSQYLANVIGNVGTQVQDATNRQSAYTALGTQLSNQLQSVSGVDPNEELIKLVQYQNSYEMSAKFVSMVSQALDQLFQMTT